MLFTFRSSPADLGQALACSGRQVLCCPYQRGISVSNIHLQHNLRQVTGFTPLSDCHSFSHRYRRERKKPGIDLIYVFAYG